MAKPKWLRYHNELRCEWNVIKSRVNWAQSATSPLLSLQRIASCSNIDNFQRNTTRKRK